MTSEQVAISIFAIGAIFWAGAIYQQVQNLGRDLKIITDKFDSLDASSVDLNVLHERVDGYGKRIEVLEAVIRSGKLS